MAFGRKAKRIAELEERLDDALNNLAVASILPQHPGLMQRVTVRKGLWYRVSYCYRHNGGPYLDIADLFVGEDSVPEYFDESMR